MLCHNFPLYSDGRVRNSNLQENLLHFSLHIYYISSNDNALEKDTIGFNGSFCRWHPC